MRRLLLVAALLVLVSASAASAWHGEKSIVAARKHAATLSARRLLHEFVPPPGATRVKGGPHGLYVRAFGGPGAEFVDLHGFWILHASAASVISFAKAHVPPGFSVGGGATNGDGSFRQIRFDWPPHGQSTRILAVSVAQRRTRTIVRADAQVVWVYPRSPQEVVPAGVREIDIKAPKVTRRVTDPAQVHQIVRWFDRLPITPPGVAAMCALLLDTNVTLVFRSASGARVASAQVPAPRASICDTIDFTIHGHRQTPLVDRPRGHSFVYRVGKLLGVRFTSSRR